jgi:hypothetical protein
MLVMWKNGRSTRVKHGCGKGVERAWKGVEAISGRDYDPTQIETAGTGD